ncbi:MAG TPA: gamma-glutamyl-gamma-aminobutyrate hydrolase family protein [Myxococcales bacterium]|nr:gamma-glutamyl-gamma-aminobutyrate hydrolase family protein [Myxococcales bacterium]
MRPVIGITPDLGHTTGRPGRPSLPRYELKQAYADAVLAAGGLPIVLPYADEEDAAAEAIEICDGLVVTGGAFDIPPELYGAVAGARMGPLKPGRTAWEQRVLRAALQADIPVLGVCGGMQLLAVELGGRLYQDIREEVPGALDHEQKGDPRHPDHAARVLPGSALEAIVGKRELQVNSTHHQAVSDAGGAKACALAPDGIVEAIEVPGRFVLGVEWHPELLEAPEHLALYRALVDRARG